MTLPKLISLLNSRTIHLSRLDFLDDPHEGSYPQQMVSYRNALYAKNGSLDHLPSHISSNQNSRTCCYVNCWALSDFESEALWRLYCGANEGVAIQSSYSKLVDIIRPDEDLFVGCINYIDYDSQNFDNPWWPAGQNGFQPVMHKRIAFAHENEVRIAKWLYQYNVSIETRQKSIAIPIILGELVEHLYISPYASEWYAQVVRDVVSTFSPNLTQKINWSKMKNDPLY